MVTIRRVLSCSQEAILLPPVCEAHVEESSAALLNHSCIDWMEKSWKTDQRLPREDSSVLPSLALFIDLLTFAPAHKNNPQLVYLSLI